jgi:plasmid stability protein
MASILLKDVPTEVHRNLKDQAARNRRSMNQEALAILERALRPIPPLGPIRSVKPTRPFTQAWLSRAIREGRE